MPSLRILTNPLQEEAKIAIAELLTKDTREILKVPIVEVFYQEYPGIFVNGSKQSSGFVTIIVEGPCVEKDVLVDYCATITDSFKKTCGDYECDISFVYHPNDHEHVGANGVLLTDRKKLL